MKARYFLNKARYYAIGLNRIFPLFHFPTRKHSAPDCLNIRNGKK